MAQWKLNNWEGLNSKETVGNNGNSAVKPKEPKLTYAETVRIKDAVRTQNELIAKRNDPLDH